ncbi:AAA family ATPase [Cellulomonas endophytica]|uniref:AAA family ATPase n=1 Tax=Cellulomonas endophytica TaxID=2494735 RepID=UPI00101139AD|nr:SMC family ATPase [Cellulomonas endophytica]
MHLRSLTLQAVGPFVGRHTVDLAALGASGLFLLEGPTGSGKSTLIDAVVFALYGKVASDATSDERLRCTRAADDVESVVDLVFECASGVYRVRRTPSYVRAKKRGTGVARQQASVRLWRLPADAADGPPADVLDPAAAPPGELLSARLDEAGHELQRVVGLDRAQFVQTMVLPQGEFARFLRADPEERRVLLQRIFGTEVYEQIAERLAAMRREGERSLEAARAGVASAVARTVGAARLDEDERAGLEASLAAPDLADALAAEVGRLTLAAEGSAAAAAGAASAAVGARTAVEAALRSAETAHRLWRRLAELRVLDARLRAEAGVAAEQEASLERARAAGTVRPALAAADAARVAADATGKALRATLDLVPAGLAGLLPPGTVLEPDGVPAAGGTDGGDPGVDALVEGGLRAALVVLERDARAALARLDRPRRLEAELEGRRREVRDARDGLDDLRAAVARLGVELDARPAARALLDGRRAAVGDASGALVRSEAAVREAEALARTVLRLEEAQGLLEDARQGATEVARAARAAVDAERDARARRIAGMAGEIAGDLVAGEPCAVCGSPEHPAPAPLAADHVTAADVDRRAREREAAEARLEAARARVTEAEARAGALRDALGGLTPDAVLTRLASAAAARTAADRAVREHDALVVALTEHDAATQALRAERAALAERLAGAESTVVALAQALDEAEAEVVAARDGHPTVHARHSATAAVVSAGEDLLRALDEHALALRQRADRERERAAALLAGGFVDATGAPDPAACRAALLERGEQRRLEQAVREHADAVAACAGGLDDPELAVVAALHEDDLPDPVALRAELAERSGEAEVATRAWHAARDRADALATRGAEAVAAARAVDASVRAAAPVHRLAGLTSGTGPDNPRALSLATFVLARRFEDVVEAANERLTVMSDGRYQLERSEDREDVRSRRTGLAMRVLDHRAGAARDPRTLSGGETFYVSLCLALGLADVVAAEAGGIELGTLFVDEGFGSLDPETLELVLAELGRLRAGGRTVGIVSHVEALKQAVADRVEVRPRGDGTSTLAVRAG